MGRAWLGVNCEFGCTDCAQLKWKDLDLENGRAPLSRNKTGVPLALNNHDVFRRLLHSASPRVQARLTCLSRVVVRSGNRSAALLNGCQSYVVEPQHEKLALEASGLLVASGQTKCQLVRAR